MCAHYTVLSEEDVFEMRKIIDEISKKFGTGAVNVGEIRPTDTAPILDGDAARPAQFGFPHWQGKGVILNARAETAANKMVFRKSLLHSRVAVPSVGYYEWAHEGKKATDKYIVTRPQGGMLYMAGLANTFRAANGKPFDAFVILTTAPTAAVAKIHDRMPVLLDEDELELWCKNDLHIDEVLTRGGVEVALRRVE